MPQPSIKPVEPVYVTAPATPAVQAVVALDDGVVGWADSPARLLHDRLVQSFVAPAAHPPKSLSARRRLAILVGSSTALWLAIGLAVTAIL